MSEYDRIVTYTGKIVRPLSPSPEMFDIEDIAHSLSNQCRFTGHTREFYSTAQHSVLVSWGCSPENKLWGLLHDASEAYISDIARPIKKTEWGKTYLEAEARLQMAIAEAFGLDPNMPEEVKLADKLLLNTEMRDLMPEFIKDVDNPENGYAVVSFEILPWTPAQSKEAFLDLYHDLSKTN